MATIVTDYRCVGSMNLKAQISDSSEKKEVNKASNTFNLIHQAAEDFVEKSKVKLHNATGTKKNAASSDSGSHYDGTDKPAELPASLREKLEGKPDELPEGKEEYADSVKEKSESDLKDDALKAMRAGDPSWAYTHRYGFGWKGAGSKEVSPEYAYERYMKGSFPELHIDPEKRVIHVNEYSLHDME